MFAICTRQFCNCQMSVLLNSPLLFSTPSPFQPPVLESGQLQGFVCDTCAARRCACPPPTPKRLYYKRATQMSPPGPPGLLSLCGRGSPLLSCRLTQTPPSLPCSPPHAGPKVLKRPEAENEKAIYTAGHTAGSEKRGETKR